MHARHIPLSQASNVNEISSLDDSLKNQLGIPHLSSALLLLL